MLLKHMIRHLIDGQGDYLMNEKFYFILFFSDYLIVGQRKTESQSNRDGIYVLELKAHCKSIMLESEHLYNSVVFQNASKVC